MQIGTTSKTRTIKQADWIWSNWLREQESPRLRYQRFTHYEFTEDGIKRPEIENALAKLLYEYHTYSPINTHLLFQLKYPLLASALTNDQRPRDRDLRSANLIEILACEFARKQGYDVPVPRLRYNPNLEQSMKGDDILGFWFAEKKTEPDVVLVGEGKFRGQFTSEGVKDGYNDLRRKADVHPISMEFVETILYSSGNEEKAVKIRQLRQKIDSQNKHVLRKHLLFLGTVGQPRNPFQYLESFPDELLPDLMAVNVAFQDGLLNWLAQVYEKSVGNEYR